MDVPYRIPAPDEHGRLDALEVEQFGATARRAQIRARWTGCTILLATCGAAATLSMQLFAARATPLPATEQSYWHRAGASICFCSCGQKECDADIADEILDCRGGRCVSVWRNDRCANGEAPDLFDSIAPKTCK
jgi:hypothetical protein